MDLVVGQARGPLLPQVPKEARIFDLQAPRMRWALSKLIRYLRKERPQTLLSVIDHSNIVALWAWRLARVDTRMAVSVHGNRSAQHHYNGSYKDRLVRLFTRLFYPWASVIIAVSHGVAEDLIKDGIPKEKIRVIYNPVVTPELILKAEELVDHPWFNFGEPPVILGVGRLTEQKDFFTLIKAFALVRKEIPARLMILGDGEDRPKLESLVRKLDLEEHIAMLGFVENPYKYMGRASVFVLSSKWEGLPTVLIEALACGCPVVSTDCPSGPYEILEGGKWGTLVPVGDEVSLAKAIVQTIKHPPNRDLLRKRGLDFSIERAIQQYVDVLFGGKND